MEKKKEENITVHLAMLAILLLALLTIFVHFNVISCGTIHPFVCDAYYRGYEMITGKSAPIVLIVFGSDGMGNPEYLEQTLRSSKFSARVSLESIERISLPELREHQLVIVERARKICTDDLQIFAEYVNTGGKLIWIGDAGTEPCENDLLLKESERKAVESEKTIGPWARKEGTKQVSFDIMLGVNYKENYCNLVQCTLPQYIGNFDFVNTDHKITYGLGQGLPFYSDFSIVETNADAFQSSLAFMDHGSDLIADSNSNAPNAEKKNFGKSFPAIVSSGVGGRVVYYAFPPEYFVSEEMPIDPKTGTRIAYWGLIENMYYGLLYN
ncbi:MAG TPA: hypothetical protein VFF13_00365 [archaeon]|nr:hypothetical protein [archaeon]